PGHRPRRQRTPKPEGRLTRQHRLGGRACRKLGGSGSSPKNTAKFQATHTTTALHRKVQYQDKSWTAGEKVP
ncbi:unnamed protein product, partial [Ascophyllum nodosum]